MPNPRYLIKAIGITLLWLVSVMPSAAAHVPRTSDVRTHTGHAHTVAIKQLARHTLNVGRSLVRVRVRKVGYSLLTRRAHFQRAARTAHADDDDAIQNDAPAAQLFVDPILELRPIGAFIPAVERQPFTFIYSPRTPRGPPAAA